MYVCSIVEFSVLISFKSLMFAAFVYKILRYEVVDDFVSAVEN